MLIRYRVRYLLNRLTGRPARPRDVPVVTLGGRPPPARSGPGTATLSTSWGARRGASFVGRRHIGTLTTIVRWSPALPPDGPDPLTDLPTTPRGTTMTTPKIATIKRSGSRYYIHPEDGGKVPGVTSVLGMLPKGFLQYWAAKVVAEEAVRDVEALSMLVSHNPDGAIDYLKRAPMRSTRQAADDGTAAHDYFERMARGEDIRMADVVSAGGNAAVTAMVGHFADFLDVVQPEYHFLEETVWSDTHRYAGSFDAFATIDGEAAWIDNKTTRSGVHPEVGLQLAAYRHADSIIRSDGSRVPMPRADGGVVVHVRPEGWKVVPVRCGREEFETFLHLRRVFDWDTLARSSMVGEALHAGGDMAAPTTGPRIAAPRKAAVR